MNLTRIVVFCVALVAAGVAVLIVRGMIGGGTPTVQASVPPPAMDEILVASKDIASGRLLAADAVRWESWPKSAMSDAYIAKTADTADMAKTVKGCVVRTPLIA